MPRLAHAVIMRLFAKGDQAPSMAERGRALEDVICYLFEKVPGVGLSTRNRLNVFESEEIDVAFWNTGAREGFYFLPHVLLVECKNWSVPVGSEEVGWFDSKLRRRGQSFGILIAANGMTGDPEKATAAHDIVRTALSEQRQFVVITRAEIEKLRSSDQLVELIQRKLCELVVSGSLWL